VEISSDCLNCGAEVLVELEDRQTKTLFCPCGAELEIEYNSGYFYPVKTIWWNEGEI
jgi:DNA-directed RNA polymerase subunit RPC12/RpoP